MNQDWDEVKALRASLREHMAEIHRLRGAAQQALEALEYLDGYNGWVDVSDKITALRAALEPVTDCHGLEQARAVAISNLLANFGVSSADSDVNVAYLHKQLDDFLMAATGCSKERGNLSPFLKSETCEYPRCLSSSGCERQCPAFPRCKDADTGKTSDHFRGATKMVATVNEKETVEPVAWHRR